MDRKSTRWEILLITILSALFFFWWIRSLLEEEKKRQKVERAPVRSRSLVLSPGATTPPPVEMPTPVEPPPPVQEPPAEPDDLKRIEGIGPKISNVLQEAEITTYAQLAATSVEDLHQIIKTGGIRVAFPESWPEQAKLAAGDDWEALKTLQSTLKGGRRV